MVVSVHQRKKSNSDHGVKDDNERDLPENDAPNLIDVRDTGAVYDVHQLIRRQAEKGAERQGSS